MELIWSYVVILMTFMVPAGGQPGFISIDCGIATDSSYNASSGIHYSSDEQYIETGVNENLSEDWIRPNILDLYRTLRSFPEGSRNCYRLSYVEMGRRYLVRAYFHYGNYDGRNRPPQFDLYIGPNLWRAVQTNNASHAFCKEVITVAVVNFINVCLVNTGLGTPFISGLELRPLNNDMYVEATAVQSLRLALRYDVGSFGEDIRYPSDPFDRIWRRLNSEEWHCQESALIRSDVGVSTRSGMGGIESGPPPSVMSTSASPVNTTAPLYMNWQPTNVALQFCIYMHFAEFERLESNMTREFGACCGSWCYASSIRPNYLSTTTVSSDEHVNSSNGQLACMFNKTRYSTLPPILNAIEVFYILPLLAYPTKEEDVEAVDGIRITYKVKRNWVGDPCLPRNHSWDGLTCNYSDSDAPTIISLNLSSANLDGKIADYLAGLTSIKSLDLSRNKLTGPVPIFLGNLPMLAFLNLDGNQLSGVLPSNLMEKSKKGLLMLSLEGNSNLCASDSCVGGRSSNNKIKIIIGASVSSVSIFFLIAVFWKYKWRKQANRAHNMRHLSNDCLHLENKQFTYSQVARITKNFERSIGKGGFGIVYHGQMSDGVQVAVKILPVKKLSPPYHGFNEFKNEVQLLTRIHHKNLVSFIGYCLEGDIMALIYEYLSRGNLSTHLSDINSEALPWSQRLHIAMDVAKGLEYLHNGCKPPIIHRDVKTANILLNERLEAKIGDFGLSKVFLNDEASHVSTAIKGTHGYLDPEYCTSNNLTDKSDVYSFGIVLLQLITGKPAIVQISMSERTSLIDWVRIMLSERDMECVVDPKLEGNYDISSLQKVVEIALACTQARSKERPTMKYIVLELTALVAKMGPERGSSSNVGAEVSCEFSSVLEPR